MIGERDLARIAGKIEYDARAPKGWRRVGRGGSRTVYLGPDGVVYKVLHDAYSGLYDADANISEVFMANQLRRRARYLWRYDIAVPEVTAYPAIDADGHATTVNAMAYLPSQKPVDCSSYDWQTEYEKTYDARYCKCRKWGTPHTCFGIVYQVLEEEFGLEDLWAPNLSFYNGKIWPIDLGE